MQYNTIHKQYRIGLGLYFTLTHDHNSHPGGWLSLSNIPAINHMKLQARDKKAAVAEVLAAINKGLDL